MEADLISLRSQCCHAKVALCIGSREKSDKSLLLNIMDLLCMTVRLRSFSALYCMSGDSQLRAEKTEIDTETGEETDRF